MRRVSRTSVSRRSLGRMIGALACVAVLSGAAGRNAFAAKHGSGKKRRPRDQMPPTHFFTMKPLTVPLLKDGVVTHHFTLVVALELANEKTRSKVFHLTPRLRDAMYRMLYRMVTFRRKGSPIPPVAIFKRNLSKIAIDVASTELVTSLIVQHAFKRRLR